MDKNILFIGGPMDSLYALRQAKKAGFGVYVTDGNPEAPGMIWARNWGDGAAVASTYDTDETIKAVEVMGQKIDGVLAVGCDVGPVVSKVAESLGLPHIPYDTTLLGWDKQGLRERLSGAGIKVPSGFLAGTNLVMLPQFGEYVVKPVKGRGGRGVQLSNGQALLKSIQFACETSPDNLAIVEQYITGPQVSAEAVIWNGDVVFCGLTDRDYRLDQTYPYFVEFGGWGSSRYERDEVGERIRATVGDVAKALGIESGTIKLDIVLNENEYLEPYVIEVAVGRLSGGHSCSLYLPISYNINVIKMACQVACGIRPTVEKFNKDRTIPLHTRGLYPDAAGATCGPERGRFEFRVSKEPIK